MIFFFDESLARLRRCLGPAAVGVAALVPASAFANPRPLPFTYPYGTLPKGAFELEQYVDLDPVKAISTESGEPVTYVASDFQTEFEFGLTDHVELGVYATFVPRPTEDFASTPEMPDGNGSKQRIRGRFVEEGQWPIDLALYGEVVENEREIELETKIILARRFGRLHIDVNLSSEFEFYYSGEKAIVLNPSLGLTYQVAPFFHVGAETWLKKEFSSDDAEARETEGDIEFNHKTQVYAGPAMMFAVGRAWWSLGGYYRLTDVTRTLEPGDRWGALWFRTLVGVEL